MGLLLFISILSTIMYNTTGPTGHLKKVGEASMRSSQSKDYLLNYYAVTIKSIYHEKLLSLT